MSALNAGTLRERMDLTFGDLVTKYLTEELPKLKPSTQGTNASLAKLHILPQWEDHRIADVDAYAVDEWLTALTFGQASKVRARNMMKRLFDLAMLWKWIPLGRNPMDLVKVKKGSKRLKRIVIISPEQFRAIFRTLPEPYNLMVLVCGCLGLRVSEALALRWSDINWEAATVGIAQVYTQPAARQPEDGRIGIRAADLPGLTGSVAGMAGTTAAQRLLRVRQPVHG
jgi:integrase